MRHGRCMVMAAKASNGMTCAGQVGKLPAVAGSSGIVGPCASRGAAASSAVPSRAAALVLGCLVVVFVTQAVPRLSAPFGASHDGFNAAVWSVGARAIESEGIAESKLGAEAPHQDHYEGPYANHPPLIYVVTWLGRGLFGDNERGSRLTVLILSVVGLLLLYGLLRQHGIPPVAASIGVGVSALTPMFLVYGVVLDTGMLALPMGIAFLLACTRPNPSPALRIVTAVTAAVLCLASWHGALLVALVLVLSLATDWYGDGKRMPIAVGAACGFVILGAWMLWVHGGFAPLLDIFSEQTSERATLLGAGKAQAKYLVQTLLFTVILLPLAFLVAVARPSLRPIGIPAVAVALIFGVVLYSGGAIHDYWNYWVLLPLAVGVAGAVQLLDRRHGVPQAIPLAVCLLIVVGGLTINSRAENNIKRGWTSGQGLRDIQWPESQEHAYVIAATPEDYYPQVGYYAERPVVHVSATQAENDRIGVVVDARIKPWIVRSY